MTDAKRVLALIRAVEHVVVAARVATDRYVEELAELDELDRAIARHPAGRAR